MQHLEARLVELAQAAKRTILNNGNQPAPPSLSDSDTAAVEGFLDDILLCLPILGYGLFETPVAAPSVPRIVLTAKALNLSSRGYESPEGFLVLKGSQARADEVESIPEGVSAMRSELKCNGVLVSEGDHLLFTQDYTFGSPSMAAGVCLGRSANGRAEWKDDRDRTLRDLQELATEGTGT